jgi:signal transduction histidine kinase/CheY-like chemotaxis protein/AraC-like DNA-binding protein/ligand-binding sensor domain-containing protein
MLKPLLRMWIALLIAWPAAVAHASERGALPVEVFDVQAMEGASVSTHIAQQADGRLLVANMRGLFRYDGSRWQLHLHPEAKGGMEHLALGADGRIHSSFNGDIGWWQDDASGTLQWHSVLARLPEDCRDVAAEVMGMHLMPARGGVVYAAATRIALVPDDPQAPVLCRPMQQLVETFVADGDLLAVHGAPLALSRLDAEFASGPVPGGDLLNGIGLSGSADTALGTLLLNNNGQILRYRGGALELWSNELYTTHGSSATQPFQAIELLADGRVAVAGMLDGVFVLDGDGRLVDRFDERAGVPARRKTLGLHLDRSGDLWLAQERTLARIGATSALTVFDDRHGLPSAVQLARWQGDLWVASRSGLFQLRDTPGGGEFQAPLPELLNLFGVAALGEDVLLVATGGLHAVRSNATGWTTEPVPLAWNQIGLLEASRFVPGRVYAGYAQGLLQVDLGADGRIDVTEIGALKMPVLRIAELDADTLWVADRVDGVLRVDLADPANPRRYGPAEGLPAGTVRIYSGPRQAWFTTLLGLRVFDVASDRFVAPTGLPAELQQDRLYSVFEDHQGNLWVRGGAILNDVFWREGAGWRIDRDLLHGVDPFPTIFGFHREEAIVWAIRANGLLRIDLAAHQSTPPAPAPLLTRVYDTRARVALALDGLADVSPAVRDLRIDLALPFLRRGSATAYRSRLAGFEDWTEWTASGQQARIYTNLPDGEFQFEVEARDALQRESRMAPVALSIAPPWFRSAPAQTAYVGASMLALWLAMRLGARRRQRQMLARQIELEAIVAARTSELKASNRQLAEQAERLAEVDRLKTRFFVNVGHEFRTPLTLVLGPLDDLLRDTRGRLAEGVRTHLQLAQRNARRVLDLIVELLDVNRLEQGQLPLRIGVHDLAELLRRVAAEAAPLIERYGQSLRSNLGLTSAPARIDPAQVERCIINLLTNAAKHSPRGTEIELSLARDDGIWSIAVRDQGRGIAPDALAHVFDRFFQAEGSDHASGYGIGLSLVREIALAHGGTVDAVSELGSGSCFTLRLPAQAEASLQLEDAATETTVGSVPQPLREDETREPARGRERVLIVDDHEDLRARVRELLGQRFEVIEAADGEQAWRSARDELPDLIVSDVMMPGCDGVELTRRLRAHADTSAIGVLLLTAKAGSDHAVAGLQAGANDYLAKPFDTSELLARCEAIVAHARRLQHRLGAAVPKALSGPIDTQDTRWRQRLDQHIAANLHDPGFGIEELAKALHADRTQLFRKCKEILGQSPSDYLRDTRLEHGRRLLEQAAGNVSEIAYACGFESLSSFTRAFKARHGLPPSHVRPRAAIG